MPFWARLMVGLSILLAAFWLDGTVDPWLEIDKMSDLGKFAWVMSLIGEGWVIAVGGAVGSGLLLWSGRLPAARIVFLVATAALLLGLTAIIVRSCVGRTRPHARVSQGIYGMWHEGRWISGQYQFSSFPSGHAATAAGVVAAVWLLRRRYVLAAAAYALLVCWSRIALGHHHLSDVVASIVLAWLGTPWVLRWADAALDQITARVRGKASAPSHADPDGQTGSRTRVP